MVEGWKKREGEREMNGCMGDEWRIHGEWMAVGGWVGGRMNGWMDR